jgi:hypothetical protein
MVSRDFLTETMLFMHVMAKAPGGKEGRTLQIPHVHHALQKEESKKETAQNNTITSMKEY